MKKIYIGVSGKFQAFHLASEFARSGNLGGLFAVDQKWQPPKHVSRRLFHNRWDLKWWRLLAQHTRMKTGHSLNKERFLFDAWLSKKLSQIDGGIFHGWNGCVSNTLKTLDPGKWLRCVERSCPHNQFQFDLVSEEAKRVGLPFHEDPDVLQKNIQELYDCDVIITPSRYSAASYADPVLIKKLRINSLGGNYTCQERPPKQPGLRILLVGNAFLRKGTHYLVEAFKKLKEPGAELWIRGEVPEAYRKRIQDPRVKIFPPLPLAKLVSLYQSATIFCLPSVDEGFGMVALEALSFGVPIVYTENCGVGDILDSQVGIRVPIRSPDRLCEAIQQLAAWNGERYAAFDVARRNILQANSWANCATRMINECYRLHN